jgi:hypothetical protein
LFALNGKALARTLAPCILFSAALLAPEPERDGPLTVERAVVFEAADALDAPVFDGARVGFFEAIHSLFPFLSKERHKNALPRRVGVPEQVVSQATSVTCRAGTSLWPDFRESFCPRD